MFALRVTSMPREAPPPEGFVRHTLGSLQVDLRCGRPFGFVCELPDALAVGAALTPQSEAQVRDLVEGISRRPGHPPVLGPAVRLLVVVRKGAPVVHLGASVRSSRACYHHSAPGSFCAATSPRELARLGVELAEDPSTVPEALAYRYVAPPRTLYRDVRRTVGGTWSTSGLETGATRIVAHYPFPQPEDTPSADEFADRVVAELEGHLQAEVARSLDAATSPGVLLSGGLDSSLLAAVALDRRPDLGSMSSSFGFLEPQDAEDEYALSVAQHLGVEHRVHGSTAEGYLEGLVHAVHAAEEPLHHLQSVMLWLLFRDAAARGHDVLLCGEGADGIFGNDSHLRYQKHKLLLATVRATGLIWPLHRALLRLVSPESRLQHLGLDYSSNLERDEHMLWSLGRYGDTSLIRRYCGTAEGSLIGERRALLEPYRKRSLLEQISILSLLGEGAATMSVWGRLGEGHGIGLHYPFPSPPVVDAAAGLPWRMKLREPKHLVRRMLRRRDFPEAIIARPKLSFGLPYRHWAPKDALFQPLVDLAGGDFDKDLLADAQSEVPSRAMVLWTMLNLWLWRELSLRGRDPADLAGEVLERHRAQQAR